MTEDTAEKAYQLGKQYEKAHGGCSQCVIAAVQDAYGVRNDEVFKAATGLVGGGGSCTDGSCGAYSGGAMIISCFLGRDREDFVPNSRNFRKNLALVHKLHDKFIQEYGSVVCRNIQTRVFGRPYYLPDRDEFRKFEEAGAHELHCPEVVGKASRWAAEIIDKLNQNP